MLEDDWRRSNKMSNLFVDEEEGEDLEASGEEEEILDPLDPANLPTFEELLAALPCEPDARVSEEERMAEAYYNAGWITARSSATTKRPLKLGWSSSSGSTVRRFTRRITNCSGPIWSEK